MGNQIILKDQDVLDLLLSFIGKISSTVRIGISQRNHHCLLNPQQTSLIQTHLLNETSSNNQLQYLDLFLNPSPNDNKESIIQKLRISYLFKLIKNSKINTVKIESLIQVAVEYCVTEEQKSVLFKIMDLYFSKNPP